MDQLEKYSDYLLIDVRDEGEYRNGHIPGAINIPYDGFFTRLARINPSKNRVILVYCYKGFRSNHISSMLQEKGYRNVHWLGSILKYEGKLEY